MRRISARFSLFRDVALVVGIAACGSAAQRPPPATPIAVEPSGGDIWAPKPVETPTATAIPMPTATNEPLAAVASSSASSAASTSAKKPEAKATAKASSGAASAKPPAAKPSASAK